MHSLCSANERNVQEWSWCQWWHWWMDDSKMTDRFIMLAMVVWCYQYVDSEIFHFSMLSFIKMDDGLMDNSLITESSNEDFVVFLHDSLVHCFCIT